ncbi:hypothetical protein GCM10009715_19540 [Paeniglutamicibacter psychrophenolicus]|uniref:Vacuolar-type H+-ATPase subunit I/STV1 n=1 Tax=Paeniglutamicibacter psychrophenolicus TaxID=257454 RepID=A0ABS4WJK0_9MICC|nr:hypothetical protein [Paeniglutamicibacter psychrophenolicus]MBP2376366.1 vacuolar-type H+-ATPase subunit I/STV1 [Paeniglutamicibacter psychrophenolicus]
MNTTAPTPASQRILTFLSGGIAIVSLAALAVILIQYMMQVAPAPAFLAVALYGLPVAFILLMVVLVLNFRERRRSR